MQVDLSKFIDFALSCQPFFLETLQVEILERVQLACLVAHQLKTLVLSVDDMGALTLHICLQLCNRLVVSVFICFIDDFVAAFHCAQFSDPQVLLESLQSLQIFLQSLDQVIC